ncbi:MAG: metal-dependent hydrolase [Candidatus Hodarchaeales archaeon]
MFPLAHLGIPLFFVDIIGQKISTSTKDYTAPDFDKKKWGGGQFDPFILMSGCLFPDFIDKTFGMILFSSGRAIGHTLMLCIICSLIFLSFQSQKAGISFFLGGLSHLILDMPGVPWFWPIYPNEFEATQNALMNLNWVFNPWTLLFEIIGLGLLYILSLQYRAEIQSWLEKTQLKINQTLQTTE